jgi:hypothetical protein
MISFRFACVVFFLIFSAGFIKASENVAYYRVCKNFLEPLEINFEHKLFLDSLKEKEAGHYYKVFYTNNGNLDKVCFMYNGQPTAFFHTPLDLELQYFYENSYHYLQKLRNVSKLIYSNANFIKYSWNTDKIEVNFYNKTKDKETKINNVLGIQKLEYERIENLNEYRLTIHQINEMSQENLIYTDLSFFKIKEEYRPNPVYYFEFYPSGKLKKYKHPFSKYYWQYEEKTKNKKQVFSLDFKGSNYPDLTNFIKEILYTYSSKEDKITNVGYNDQPIGFLSKMKYEYTKKDGNPKTIIWFLNAADSLCIVNEYNFYLNPLIKLKLYNVSRIEITEEKTLEGIVIYVDEFKSDPTIGSIRHKFVLNKNTYQELKLVDYKKTKKNYEIIRELSISERNNFGQKLSDKYDGKIIRYSYYLDSIVRITENKNKQFDTTKIYMNPKGQFNQIITNQGTDFYLPIEKIDLDKEYIIYKYKNSKDSINLKISLTNQGIKFDYINVFKVKDEINFSRTFNESNGRLLKLASPYDTISITYDEKSGILKDSIINDNIQVFFERKKENNLKYTLIERYFNRETNSKLNLDYGYHVKKREFEIKLNEIIINESYLDTNNKPVKNNQCNCERIYFKYNNLNQLKERILFDKNEYKIEYSNETFKNKNQVKLEYFYDTDGKIIQENKFTFYDQEPIRVRENFVKSITEYEFDYVENTRENWTTENPASAEKKLEKGKDNIHKTVTRFSVETGKKIRETYENSRNIGVRSGSYNQYGYLYEETEKKDTIKVTFLNINHRPINEGNKIAKLVKIYDDFGRLVKEYRESGESNRLTKIDWDDKESFPCKTIEYHSDSGPTFLFEKKIAYWEDIEAKIPFDFDGYHSKEQDWEIYGDKPKQTLMKFTRSDGKMFLPEDSLCDCYEEIEYNGKNIIIRYKKKDGDKATVSKWHASELIFKYNLEDKLIEFEKGVSSVLYTSKFIISYDQKNPEQIFKITKISKSEGSYVVRINFDSSSGRFIGYSFQNKNSKPTNPKERGYSFKSNNGYFDQNMNSLSKEKISIDQDLENILMKLGLF